MQRWPIIIWLVFLLGCSAAPANPNTTSHQEAIPSATPPAAPLPTPVVTIYTPAAPNRTPTPDSEAGATRPGITPPAPDGGDVAARRLIVGYSSLSQTPLPAYQFGAGELAVVVMTDQPALADLWLTHFTAQPEATPAGVSLWIAPDINPDRQPVFTNADTNFDGCTANNWYGSDGLYPFALPETRAMRDLTARAWVVILVTQGETPTIQLDSCRQQPAGEALAAQLRAALPYPTLALRDTAGHMLDYLAGEGIAAVHVTLPPDGEPSFMAALANLLTTAPNVYQAEVAPAGATFDWLGADNTGQQRYLSGAFYHPVGLALTQEQVYLIDGGRVLALDATQTAPPRVLLRPGDEVGGVRVQEPLDLALDGAQLVVLDRVGDVYRYAGESVGWRLERYDRPVRDLSSHYYAAVEAAGPQRTLLEVSYPFMLRYGVGEEVVWPYPDLLGVDISQAGETLYLLLAGLTAPTGQLHAYRQGERFTAFEPNFPIQSPRQVVATPTSVYVLDQAGFRLLAFDPASGRLQAIYRFHDRRRISAMAVDAATQRLLLVGRDYLAWVGQPERAAEISLTPLLTDPQPHDLERLNSLAGFRVPLGIADFNQRAFQLPGAPRHYRLGVHEGLDFYWQPDAPVMAAADGVVTRLDLVFVEPTPAQFDFWRAESQRLGYTSDAGHDFYRGRQVWLDHGQGITTRYVHLSAVESILWVGASVTQGQTIAYVGDSGSPGSLEAGGDVHLHFELRIGDGYLGQFLRPVEIRDWLRRVLH